ncbi:MAG: 2-amino-4-hydroxy-6-hydroxymethyldihydropteridine diphosphokinase [Pikeienuella sp.]
MKNTQILVAVGANLPSQQGNSLRTCKIALDRIESLGVEITHQASWRRSPAFPAESGPDFTNGAIQVETTLSPATLLVLLHKVEADLGRERPVRWGPRVCDLDLIAYGDVVSPNIDTLQRWMTLGDAAGDCAPPNELILPHPRMHERAFVLGPLMDIAPDWLHPQTGRTVREMWTRLSPEARAQIEIIEHD